MDNKKLIYIIIGLVLYLASTVGSYFFFQTSPAILSHTLAQNNAPAVPAKTNSFRQVQFAQNQPKTQACPLNGVYYSTQQEAWWKQHAPLGVMIENSVDARPQSGISFADVTYEAVAEGGITRTLNIFYCQDAGIIGPVRSARTYFVSYVSEYGKNPLYAHVGGANTPGLADAIGQIGSYGWTGYNDMDQFGIGYPTYWRDETRQGHAVATEHTMYSTTTGLWGVAKQRGLTNVDKDGNSWDANFVAWTFKSDSAAANPTATSITVPFWGDQDYVVQWKFDKASDAYLRFNGGVAHIDRDINKQLSAKDVVVLFETQQSANDGYENNLHNLYGTTGTGDAAIFMDGKEIKGTWKKADRTSRTLLYDENGNEIQFNRGHIWFEIVPLDQKLTVS